MDLRWDSVMRSKNFITTEVRVKGLLPLSPLLLDFLVTGMVVEALRQAGT